MCGVTRLFIITTINEIRPSGEREIVIQDSGRRYMSADSSLLSSSRGAENEYARGNARMNDN